jgi:hypothetical protein
LLVEGKVLGPKFARLPSSAQPRVLARRPSQPLKHPRDFAPHSLRAARAPDTDAIHANFEPSADNRSFDGR